MVSDKGSQLTSAKKYVNCQYRNGLAESRVKALKSSLSHMMTSTIICDKPTLFYTELQVILARAASIVNDRPVGARGLTEYDLQPLTPNMLLLGSTGGGSMQVSEDIVENYSGASKYHEELLDVWWKKWEVQVFPHLLPFGNYKDTQRCTNLRPGDICLLRYDGKICRTYKLCRVISTILDHTGLVRTVKVGYRNKRFDKR